MSRVNLQRTYLSNFLATRIVIWLRRVLVTKSVNITFVLHPTSLFMKLACSFDIFTLSR
jgi:hypothetical protein